jgi:hypothetical protein
MLHLHYYPGTAAMAPHIVLQELGVPFELVRPVVQRVFATGKLVQPWV